MGIAEILASIDHQIRQLQQVKALLGGGVTASAGTASKSKKRAAPALKPVRRKKTRLSPEGRKRIAEAQKRRWEAQRKAAAQKK